jgi:hypothetical protein
MLKRLKERPVQTVKVVDNGKEKSIKVFLLVKPIEEWISKFLPEKVNTEELNNSVPNISD